MTLETSLWTQGRRDISDSRQHAAQSKCGCDKIDRVRYLGRDQGQTAGICSSL